jgi:hypothetical protein
VPCPVCYITFVRPFRQPLPTCLARSRRGQLCMAVCLHALNSTVASQITGWLYTLSRVSSLSSRSPCVAINPGRLQDLRGGPPRGVLGGHHAVPAPPRSAFFDHARRGWQPTPEHFNNPKPYNPPLDHNRSHFYTLYHAFSH